MLKKLIFLPIIFLSLLVISFKSQADVSVDSSDSNTAENFTPFTSAIVPTGTGQVGDYQLIVCSVNGNNNFFSSPSPGTWTEHDNASCEEIGSPSEDCTHSIWGRFTSSSASEDITCSWSNGINNFTAGSFRYSNVDTMNPVINIACNTGFGTEVIAPSIMTEAGSQVARIYTHIFFNFVPPPFAGIVTKAISDSFIAHASFDLEAFLSTFGETTLFPAAGATGEATLSPPPELEAAWRACTIALRMQMPPPTDPPPTDPPPTITPTPTIIPVISTSIPTLSQWGHLSIAILAVLIGVWFLRKHRVKT